MKKKPSKAKLTVEKFLNTELPDLSKSAELLDYKLMEVRVSSIKTNKQVRTNFNEEEIKGLAKSIEEEGLINPIEVRKSGEDLIVISGERRFRAVKILGWVKVPAIIRSKIKEDQIGYRQLIENLQRVDLSPIEESIALNDIKKKFKITNSEIADRIGKSKTRVTRTLNYLSLSKGGAYTHLFGLGPMVLDELLSIKNDIFYENILKKIKINEINSSNIREEIAKERNKLLKDEEKKERLERNIDSILTKVEEIFYKQIDKNLLKLRIDFRKDLSDEMIEKINSRVKKLEDELRNFSNFLKKEHLGSVDATLRLSDQNPSKKKKNLSSTSLESIEFSKIDSKLASNKNDVINFILGKIDIQKKVLMETDIHVLVDHWNALPYYSQKIDSVQNWFFKSITKPFTLPKEYLRSKKMNINVEFNKEPYSIENEIKTTKDKIKNQKAWFGQYGNKKFEDLDLPTKNKWTAREKDLEDSKKYLRELKEDLESKK